MERQGCSWQTDSISGDCRPSMIFLSAMGMDLLDFTFRVEKAFRIKMPREVFDRLPQRIPFDATAGEMHDLVLSVCAHQGVHAPPSSWNRVKKVLVDVTGKSPKLIRRETWIVRELGF